MDETNDLDAALERLDEICTALEAAAACGPALGHAAQKRSAFLRSAYTAALDARHNVRGAIAERAVERERAEAILKGLEAHR